MPAAVTLLPSSVAGARGLHTAATAKGRLTWVTRSGTVNIGVVAAYAFDPVDNRTSVMVDGTTPRVPALGGLMAIPLLPG